MQRTKNKQPVRRLMASWRIRMRPVGTAIRHALTEFASMPTLLTVPVIGSISSTAIVTPQTLLTATKLSISQRALPQTSRPVLV